jgi:hypothetical protein
VVLTFCVDFNRVSRWCEQRQAEPGFNTIHRLPTAPRHHHCRPGILYGR